MEYLLLTAFTLILILYLLKTKDKVSPSSVISLYWVIQSIFIISVYDKFNISFLGLIYILLGCIIFVVAGKLGKDIVLNNSKPVNVTVVFNANLGKKILLAMIFFSSLLAVYQLSKNGFKISSLLNFDEVLRVNNESSKLRYSGDVTNTLIDQFGRCILYSLPLYSGFYYAFKKSKLLTLFTFIPILFIALTQSMKAGLINSCFLWTIGFIVAKVLVDGTFKIKTTIILKVSIVLMCLLIVLFISMMFRVGSFDIYTFKIVSSKFVTYAIGHLAAFNIWFVSDNHISEPTLGIQTFYGLSNFLGIATRQQGIYTDFVSYQFNGQTFGTNVYTAYRPLIEDFTIIGSLMIMFIFGLISNLFYTLLKLKKYVFSSLFIYIAALFYILWSFVTSTWAYTSYIATIVLIILILKISLKISYDKK